MAQNHDFEELSLHCCFCGASNMLTMDDEGVYYILCLECSACGPTGSCKEEAILSWCERFDPEDARTIYVRQARRRVAFLG